jgi:general secretion pathway protein G
MMGSNIVHRRGGDRICGRRRGLAGGRAAGFTLMEILIVVLILGVMAAIVIPQFANASSDTKKSSLSASLNSLRTQIEFYMLQHGELPPTLTGADWSALTAQSTFRGETCGPYLTAAPVNQLNGKTDVLVVAADVAGGQLVTGTDMGFIYNPTTGKIWATNTAQDRVYNEVNPADPNN